MLPGLQILGELHPLRLDLALADIDRLLSGCHLTRNRVGHHLVRRPIHTAGVDHQRLGAPTAPRQRREDIHRILTTAAPPPNRARRSAFVASGSSIGPAFVFELGVAYCSDMSSMRNEIKSLRRA